MISVKKAKAFLADSTFIYSVTADDVKTFEPKVPVRFTHVDGIFLYGAEVELPEFKGKELEPNGEDFEPEVIESEVVSEEVPAEEVVAEAATEEAPATEPTV